ncbi:MAG: DegT/DnrJ/EryC1/StrS family aminotransferase [Phycisphaerae bacterium]|nr:DegT/DnrJ/EryC1/StrS family aminotransferase [Phycisphaerae bacterium]
MSGTHATDLPAILGGNPAVTIDDADANRWPIIAHEEIAAVTEVLRSGELSLHRVTRELEDDYRQSFGVRHAIAYCNATSAIFAALHAFGLHPGDEVIVPSATYWASVMPALWCGAVPVFCESEPRQLGLDPEDVARKITDRTKAMIVVHLWGMPSRMEALTPIAQEHKLKVLEDASHAQGARWRGRPVGTLGDAAVFSLQTNKLAPAGEGGILLTSDDAIHEHAICLGHFERILELQTPARRFAGTGFGFKHRMAPLSAAVARVQLRHLAERNAQRNANIRYLSELLEPLGINAFLPPDHVERVYFLFMVQNEPNRTGLPTDVLVRALQAEGCKVGCPRYPLLHEQPVFTEGLYAGLARIREQPQAAMRQYSADDLPRTTAGNRTLLQLPSFPSAERDLLDQYAYAFRKVMGRASEIAEAIRRQTAREAAR